MAKVLYHGMGIPIDRFLLGVEWKKKNIFNKYKNVSMATEAWPQIHTVLYIPYTIIRLIYFAVYDHLGISLIKLQELIDRN